MNVFLSLSIIAVLPVILSVILYELEKKTAYQSISPRAKQLICGVLFGGLAVLGTEYGVDIGGAVANTRDAAVLTAGLLFGAPAGIIAGLIGGIERYFATYWGGGAYTQIACTVSTILAGLIGAAFRKFMFDNKKPSVIYGLVIGLVTEVLHMLMVFVTNMSDVALAFSVVERCAAPMILANGFGVMLSVLAVSILGKEFKREKHSTKQIAIMFQRRLVLCVIAAFLATGAFTFVLQYKLADNNAQELLSLNIQDMQQDIADASDKNLLALTYEVKAEIEKGNDLFSIAEKHDIAEINVISTEGIIIDSTQKAFLNYDMKSGSQSAAFLVLLSGEREYVQKYQTISYDRDMSRKYAGVTLPRGGFVQVGYDAEQFQKDIAAEVVGAAKNRHVGQNGFMLIADENWNIVSDQQGNEGKNLVSTGIWINQNEIKEGDVFKTKVYGKDCFCMYRVSEGYFIISVLPVSEAIFTRNLSIYITAFMEVIVFVGLFVLVYYLVKTLVVNNIKKVNESLAEITGGNLEVEVDVRSNEEFASLSDDINATVVTLKRYIAEAAARIDQELAFAKSIQHAALPSVFPPYPKRHEFEIFASMDTAKEVGGDFYDFYFVDNNRLAFLIADVSGKGIPAAMFMMTAKTLIKGFAEAGKSAAEVLTLANDKLCENNDANMFVTAWLGILNLTDGKLTFANAGHNPPLLKRKDGDFAYLKSRPGLVLAGMDGILYRESELTLLPGDKLYLYTDGVTEATDVHQQLYGEERLEQVLNREKNCSAEALCKAVKQDVDQFSGEAPQFDDITMLSVTYFGDANEKEV